MTWTDEDGNEIELRSGAMPEDWHERNDPGYIPGGADAMAERILSDPPAGHDGPSGEGWDMARDAETGKPRPRKPTAFDGINNLERP